MLWSGHDVVNQTGLEGKMSNQGDREVKMKTKELTNYMESLARILTSDDNLKARLREEIIKRLEEHEDFKKKEGMGEIR